MSGDAPSLRNRWTALKLGAVGLGMFGFGFALVPLYDVICEVTGINGRSSSLVGGQDVSMLEVDRSRTITVEFVAIVNRDLDWDFVPKVRSMEVHPGQQYVAYFEATNHSSRQTVAQAVPSVSPSVASRHFIKTECFCFTRQEFGPRESREMPVVFVIDPALASSVERVSLAYTFFELNDLASASGSTRGFGDKGR